MGTEEDSIEQSVASRRERLLALRAAQELSNDGEEGEEEEEDEAVEDEAEAQQQEYLSIYLPFIRCFLFSLMLCGLLKLRCRMKFRNYVPHDKNLQEGKLAPAVLPKFEDPVDAVPPPEPEAKEVLLLC